MARTKLTDEIQKKIVDALKAGNFIKTASEYAGITDDTFQNWLKWGEAGRKPYRDFWLAVRQAQVECKVRVVAQWQGAMQQDWRACMEFLARRYPAEWSPKLRHEHTGEDGQPIQMRMQWKLERLSAEELDQLEAFIKRISAP